MLKPAWIHNLISANRNLRSLQFIDSSSFSGPLACISAKNKQCVGPSLWFIQFTPSECNRAVCNNVVKPGGCERREIQSSLSAKGYANKVLLWANQEREERLGGELHNNFSRHEKRVLSGAADAPNDKYFTLVLLKPPVQTISAPSHDSWKLQDKVLHKMY